MPTKVDFQLKEYQEALPVWELVTDCDKGQKKVKEGKHKYLPQPNPTDTTNENELRYQAYLDRAVFSNYTRRTVSGLLGQVFAKEPTKNLPPALDQIVEDADDTGVKLDQQARKTLRNVLRNGRAALYVDFPATDSEVTRADKTKATIVSYNPQQIINWRTERFGDQIRLTLVVIEETVEEEDPDNEFAVKEVKQWRVLRLDGGMYSQQLWRETGGNSITKKFILVDEFFPKTGAGVGWSQIPFTFVGAVNNDPTVDPSPMYDIAVLNIGHYRNSADYEESVFMVGQPMVWMGGMTQGWLDSNYKDGLLVGSRQVAFLPEGGVAGILQPEPNTLAFEAMTKKENQMVALGAKVVEARSVQATATEVALQNQSESSILAQAANNVSAAYEQALAWAMNFMERNEFNSQEIEYALNTDFAIATMDPQMIDAVIRSWHSGGISDEEMRSKLEKMNLAFEEFEEWREKQDANPSGLGIVRNTEDGRNVG